MHAEEIGLSPEEPRNQGVNSEGQSHSDMSPPDPKELRTPEMKRSEEIAGQKLQRLLDPNFRDFGVRFVNQSEYFALLETKQLPRGEVFVSRQGSSEFIDQERRFFGPEVLPKEPSFTEFLERLTAEPEFLAKSLTDWDHNTLDLESARSFLEHPREAHEVSSSPNTGH